mgnify:CR=1 FL=1
MTNANALPPSKRPALLWGAVCLLLLGIGAAGTFGMGRTSEGMRSVYEDRVVPLKQLKAVADATAKKIAAAMNGKG